MLKGTAAKFCASVLVKPYMWLSTGLGLARLLPVSWQGFFSKVIQFGSSLDTRARMTGEQCASASTLVSRVSGPSVDVNNDANRIVKLTLRSVNMYCSNVKSLVHVGKIARAPMGGTGGMAPAVGTVVAMLRMTSRQLWLANKRSFTTRQHFCDDQ